jgi:hypothetical protein
MQQILAYCKMQCIAVVVVVVGRVAAFFSGILKLVVFETECE